MNSITESQLFGCCALAAPSEVLAVLKSTEVDAVSLFL